MGKCNNLILHCMDYRLQKTLRQWIDRRGLVGDVDIIAFGGACKQKEFALKNIGLCCEKHGVTNIFISQHDDCAGYGGHAAFSSIEAERETIFADMSKVKDQILKAYPDVTVTMLHFAQDGDDWKIVEVQ